MPLNAEPPSPDTDVLIVGAGPIGLTTAIALRHHGIDCTVIETRTSTREHSRANNLWARPQELLASIGLRDALAQQAYAIHKVNFFLNGTPAPTTRIDDVQSPYPTVLYSGQDVIEKVMLKELDVRGGRLIDGHTVISIVQDAHGVTATMRDEDGTESQMRARFLVAADGAKSMIRGMLNLDFPLERFEGRMNRQVDAKLSWRRSTDPDQLWFFYYEKGFCGIMPVWGGYHRLFFLADDTGVPDRDPTLDEIQATAREVTGDDTLTLTDPVWLSHSRFQHGHAESYAKGRVFLAGDAGHLSLPIGGQGMNAGLHDAVGLAWRVAMTLRGKASDVVLNSYSVERAAEHGRLDDQQAKGFRRSVYRGRGLDIALNTALAVWPGIGTQLQGTDDLQQLTVRYPSSPLNADHLKGFAGITAHSGAAPGDRAPDAEVTTSGCTTNLHSHIYNPDGDTTGWTLLAFDGRNPSAGDALLRALDAVGPFGAVHARLVLAGPAINAPAAQILSDLDGKAHRAYGLEGCPALILIRPDGHISFRGPADGSDLLAGHCKGLFQIRTGRPTEKLADASV